MDRFDQSQPTANPKQNQCSKHPQYSCDFLSLDSNQDNLLKCSRCIIAQRQNFTSLVVVKDIFDCSDVQTVLNWPPLSQTYSSEENTQKTDIIERISLIGIQKTKQEEMRNNLVEFFQKVSKEALAEIQKVMKNLLAKADGFFSSQDSVLQSYHEIASLSQLKQIIQEENTDIEKQEKLRLLVQGKIDSKDKNTKQILESLEKYEKLLWLADENLLTMIKSNIITSIQNFNFSLIDDPFDEECKEKQESSLKVEKLMKLISNKTNMCSDRFIRDIKNCFQRIEPIFEHVQFDDELLHRPIDFESFSKEWLQNIDDLMALKKQIEEKEQITEKEDELAEINEIEDFFELKQPLSKSQPQSQLFLNILNNIFAFTKNEETKIIKLLQAYPIFEMPSFSKTKLIIADSGITKSTYLDSQNNILASRNVEGQPFIQRINSKNHSYGWINGSINNSLNYVLRIKAECSSSPIHSFWIGIIPKSELHTHWAAKSKYIQFCLHSDCGVDRILKGNLPLSQCLLAPVAEFEIRFCIATRTFVCLDWPSGNHVNAINDDNSSKFNANNQYNISFYLFYPSHRLTITHFGVVDQFQNILPNAYIND